MKIYTLAFSHSYSTDRVNTFTSETECFNAMVKDVEKTLGVHIDMNFLKENLKSGECYVNDILFGSTYVQDGTKSNCWEMFTTEISDIQFGRAMIVNAFFKLFPNCKDFENVVINMVNEYSDDFITKSLINNDVNEFIINNIIGECLYQHAAAELGGKTDEKSTATIFEYFNGYKFLQVFNTTFNLRNTDWADQDPIAHENWIYAMLTLCDGEKDAVKAIRQDIDLTYHTNIFFDLGEYKDKMCENHREKSSLLSDEEYNDIMFQIFTCYNKNGKCERYFENRVDELWKTMIKEIYKIILAEGYDYFYENFCEIIGINHSFLTNRYELVIEGAFYDVAYCLDEYINKKQ